MCVLKIKNTFVYLMFIVKSSKVHEMDCLREETVPVPGQMVTVQRRSVLDVRGLE